MLLHQLLLLSMLFGIGYLEGWSLEDFGVSEDPSPVVSFAVGVTGYAVFMVTYGRTVSYLGLHDRLADASFDAIRLTCPRDRNQKFLFNWSACLLNPITEEVLFRGVLIHGFGEDIGSMATAVGIGFSLSLLVHTYQGVLAIPGQFVFHGFAVILLLSRFGLLACIGFHFAGDLYPTLMSRRMMYEWVARRRSRLKQTTHDGQSGSGAESSVPVEST